MHALGTDRLPAVDEVIVDKYRVVRVIARGGMGIVLEAHHLRLDRPVALKILQGAAPSSIAPVTPRKVVYSVNLRTARLLKLDIRAPVLQAAHAVIE